MSSKAPHDHNPLRTTHEEAAKLASELAPLEEQERRSRNGAIVLDTKELKLPKEFMEEERRSDGLRLEPVVVFILALALAFIAFIAYLISIEPSA